MLVVAEVLRQANVIERIGKRGVKATVGRPAQIKQAVEILGILYDTVKDRKTRAPHKAACARAWDSVAERIRILRGQPMPGVLRPEGSGKSRKSRGKGAEVVPKEAAKTEVKPTPSPAVQPTVLPKPEAPIVCDTPKNTATGGG